MIGEKIRSIRKLKRLTLSDLGEKTDNTAGYLSQVERGLIEPSISSLRKIAAALQTPVYYFLLENSEDSFIIRKNNRKVVETPWTETKMTLLSPVSMENKNLSMVGIEVVVRSEYSCDV